MDLFFESLGAPQNLSLPGGISLFMAFPHGTFTLSCFDCEVIPELSKSNKSPQKLLLELLLNFPFTDLQQFWAAKHNQPQTQAWFGSSDTSKVRILHPTPLRDFFPPCQNFLSFSKPLSIISGNISQELFDIYTSGEWDCLRAVPGSPGETSAKVEKTGSEKPPGTRNEIPQHAKKTG